MHPGPGDQIASSRVGILPGELDVVDPALGELPGAVGGQADAAGDQVDRTSDTPMEGTRPVPLPLR